MKEDKVKILIVEDEAIVAMGLAASLTNEGYLVIGMADNAIEAIEIYKSSEPDLVLVDINIIGETDGIALVEKLLQVRQCPVIYLTALSDAETVARMKHTRPSAYLTKPYSTKNLHIAIELALSNFAVFNTPPQKVLHDTKESGAETDTIDAEKEQILQLNEQIFIKQNYRFVKVKLADILFAEAENNYVKIATEDKNYRLRMSLQQLEDKINYSQLIRVHRSYLVNMSAITVFSDIELQVGKHTIPIGRNYRDSFIKQFSFR